MLGDAMLDRPTASELLRQVWGFDGQLKSESDGAPTGHDCFTAAAVAASTLGSD